MHFGRVLLPTQMSFEEAVFQLEFQGLLTVHQAILHLMAVHRSPKQRTSFWLSSQCQRIVSLLIWNLLRFAVRHLWRSKGQSNSSNSHENRRKIKSTRNQCNHNRRTAKSFVSAQTRGTISVQCETRCELNPFRIARGGLGSRSTSLPGWFSHDFYIYIYIYL